ncbi:hypothetical protein [Pleomorphovibrio marinus]|uniref:hypothetical protein n=1 Tax=Pleomorphovibrio marinus TaxID=2164132 RepID=UPI000E0A974E|nr:hypothetical protein [Pleomorphovibrio marinus]
MKLITLAICILSLSSCMNGDDGTYSNPYVIHLDWLRVHEDTYTGEEFRIFARLRNIPHTSRWWLSMYVDGEKIHELRLQDSVEGDDGYLFRHVFDHPGEYHIEICLRGRDDQFCREIDIEIL